MSFPNKNISEYARLRTFSLKPSENYSQNEKEIEENVDMNTRNHGNWV